MKKKVIAGIATAIVLLGAAGGISGLLKGGADTAVPVTAAEAVAREMVSKVEVTGNVELKEPVRIYASNNGKIKRVLVSEGDYVEKGQVLFTYDEDNTDSVINQLDDARLSVKALEEQLRGLSLPATESEIKAAEAEITQCKSTLEDIEYSLTIDRNNLAKAESDLERANEDFEKNQQLYQGGVIALNELNTYRDSLTAAKTQLENCQTQLEKDSLAYTTANASLEAAEVRHRELVAKPNLDSIQNEINSMEIQLDRERLKVSQLEEELSKYKEEETAPFSGRVSAVNQNDGATVLEDTAVIEMVNENDTRVYIDIPEWDMPEIKEGLTVILTGDGFSGEAKAKIKTIKFEAEEKMIDNANKNVVEAEVEVEDKALLRPGYTINASIIKAVDEEAVVIPVMSYLTDDNGKDFVYIINQENILEKREITLKDYDDMLVSVEGVKAGERLVDTPDPNNPLIKEGAKVKSADSSQVKEDLP